MCVEILGHSTLSIWQCLWFCWSSHSNPKLGNRCIWVLAHNLRTIFRILPCLLTVVRSNQIKFYKPFNKLKSLGLEPCSEQLKKKWFICHRISKLKKPWTVHSAFPYLLGDHPYIMLPLLILLLNGYVFSFAALLSRFFCSHP